VPLLLLARNGAQHHDQYDGETLEKDPLPHHSVLLHPEGFLRGMTVLTDVLGIAKKRAQTPDKGGDHGNRATDDQYDQKE